MGRILAVTGLITLLLVAFTPQSAAHGVSDTADFHLAQSFAGNELTLVVRRTQDMPGPLNIDFIAHDPVRPADVDVHLTGTAQRARVLLDGRGVISSRITTRSRTWSCPVWMESSSGICTRSGPPLANWLSGWRWIAPAGISCTPSSAGQLRIAAGHRVVRGGGTGSRCSRGR